MGRSYPYLFQWVASFFAVYALMWTADAPLEAAGTGAPDAPAIHNSLENNEDNFGESDPSHTSIAVGPGRVSFEVSSHGRWVGLIPDWTGGTSVIAGGGFVLMAVDEDGEVVELANTASDADGRLRERKETRGLRSVHEGATGGARYPMPKRDDDGDGRVDEDRLDGVDNDGDDRIDEDFAAIGDQMVTLSYEAVGEDGKPLFLFHQECYTWTLPHIDGMVAIKLVVRNVGKRTWDNVYVGAVVGQQDQFSMSTQDLSPAHDDERLVSKGVLLTRDGETEGTSRPVVAAVFFTQPAAETASWLTGVATSDRRLADRVRTYLVAERGPATDSAPPQDGSKGEFGPEPPVVDAPGDGVERSSKRIAYGVSPDLGTLAPGEEVVVYTALVAVPTIEKIDRAIEDAYRTVIGDGIHRMVPPPVSLKRWTVWGTYRFDEVAASDSPAGVTITLENAVGRGIGTDDISYLSGFDLASAEVSATSNGDIELSVRGELYEEVADMRGRVDLHGRLRNGEFFDVILQPIGDSSQSGQLSGMSETQYWSRPGKLDDALLTGSPNPFRESTTIYYEVPTSTSDEDGSALSFFNPVETSVKIYNVAGRLVSILVDTIVTPGQYATQWNGADDDGNGVASGVYYVKLQIGKKHVTKRLIQLK